MSILVGVVSLYFLPAIFGISCYDGEINLWLSSENSNKSCQSTKYCGVHYTYTTIYQTCYDDPNTPEFGCSISFNDAVSCYCNSSMCNTVDKVNEPSIPYLETVECVTVIFGDKPSSCASSLCSYKYTASAGQIRTCSSPSTGFDGFDMPLPFYKDFNEYYLYADACYNFTYDTNSSMIFCRCREAKCNNDQPYKIPTGNVECAMSGNLVYPDNKNESALINDTCLGHFCYIKAEAFWGVPDFETGVSTVDMQYEKGCLNVVEHGKYKVKVATFHHSNIQWYICKTASCNLNLTVIQRAISAYGAPQSTGEIETTTQSAIKITDQPLFWAIILMVIGCTRKLI